MKDIHKLPKVAVCNKDGKCIHVPGISNIHVTPHIMKNLEQAARNGKIKLEVKLGGEHPMAIITMTDKSMVR